MKRTLSSGAGPHERLGIFLGKERGECDRLGKYLGKDARESAGGRAKGPRARCIGRESEFLKRSKQRQQRGSFAQFPWGVEKVSGPFVGTPTKGPDTFSTPKKRGLDRVTKVT